MSANIRYEATRQRAQELAQRILEIGRECASLPVLNPRSPEDMLYDESCPRGEEAGLTEAPHAAPATLGKAWAGGLREFHRIMPVREKPALLVEQILEEDRSDRV